MGVWNPAHVWYGEPEIPTALCTQPYGFACQPLRGLTHASIARGIIDDNSVRVTVVDAEKNKVEYNGETTSLSPLAEKLRNVSAIQGTSVFTYNGKKITDIAEETQWKKEDTLSETETDDLL